eukprot:c42195_g1_i1 orf=2-322(-)
MISQRNFCLLNHCSFIVLHNSIRNVHRCNRNTTRRHTDNRSPTSRAPDFPFLIDNLLAAVRRLISILSEKWKKTAPNPACTTRQERLTPSGLKSREWNARSAACNVA